MENPTRQAGEIAKVDLYEEPGRGWVFMLDIAHGCVHQGFGGSFRTEADARDFAYGVLRAFKTAHIEDLKGEPCYALRCWGHYNATIEGIESVVTGARFTKHGWSRTRGATYPDPLDAARQSLKSEAAHLRQRLADTERRLATIADDYVAWEPR